MAGNNDKKYPSIYNPGKFISPLHYVVELICQKNAKYTKKEIPIFFWRLKEWGAFYRFQLKRAKELLEHYSSEAIVKALNDKRTWNIYSLQAPWLIPIICEYQNKVNIIPPTPEGPEMSGTEFKRKSFKNNKKNLEELLDGPT